MILQEGDRLNGRIHISLLRSCTAVDVAASLRPERYEEHVKPVLHRLVAVVLVSIPLFALLEATIRMTPLERFAVDWMTERVYPVPPGREEGLFSTRVYDPLLSWRLRPGGWLPGRVARINSQGLVGAEFSWKKPADTFRILALGDSVTYGLYACGIGIFCRRAPYPSALENLLKEGTASDRFEVLDAGVYGYTTLQGLRYYRVYLTGLDEDLVALMFGWNDHGAMRGSEPGDFRSAWVRDIAYGAYRLAQLYLEQGHRDKAIGVLERLQKLDPLNDKISFAIQILRNLPRPT